MTAQELRIGNYYDHNGQVKTVTPDVIQEVWIAERLWCKPIPLTEQWLIKFGHVQKGIKGYWSKDVKNGYLAYTPEGFYLVIENNDSNTKDDCEELDMKLKIQYVHQLQNLYFALTGSELTIKE